MDSILVTKKRTARKTQIRTAIEVLAAACGFAKPIAESDAEAFAYMLSKATSQTVADVRQSYSEGLCLDSFGALAEDLEVASVWQPLIAELDRERDKYVAVAIIVFFFDDPDVPAFVFRDDANRREQLEEEIETGGAPIGLLRVSKNDGRRVVEPFDEYADAEDQQYVRWLEGILRDKRIVRFLEARIKPLRWRLAQLVPAREER
jgi:hypothetical protein